MAGQNGHEMRKQPVEAADLDVGIARQRGAGQVDPQLQRQRRPLAGAFGDAHDEALALLRGAEAATTTDASIRYLRALVKGHVLLAQKKDAEAEQAYRAALAIAPAAQSARVGLMNAELMQNGRAEAEALAEAVQVAQDDALDPWWTYWQGQYRFYPAVMARLREMGR